MRWDPSGCFWDAVLDIGFIAWGLQDFIKKPTWAKAGWLLLDIGLAIILFIPNIAAARHLGKIDNIVDIVSTANKFDNFYDGIKIAGKIDNFTDIGGVVRFANSADMTNDAMNTIMGLNRIGDATVSSLKAGNRIHDGFHIFSAGKEAVNIYGRMDDVSDAARLIFELKPNNARNIRKGINQLIRYNQAYDGLYRMILILY